PEVTIESARTAEHFRVLARVARDPGTIRKLWERAGNAGVLDEDLKSFLTARAADLGAPAKTNGNGNGNGNGTGNGNGKPAARAGKRSRGPAGARGEVVEGEPEPDAEALWFQIMSVAGADPYRWSAEELERRVQARFDHSSDEVNGWQMATFLDELRSA